VADLARTAHVKNGPRRERQQSHSASPGALGIKRDKELIHQHFPQASLRPPEQCGCRVWKEWGDLKAILVSSWHCRRFQQLRVPSFCLKPSWPSLRPRSLGWARRKGQYINEPERRTADTTPQAWSRTINAQIRNIPLSNAALLLPKSRRMMSERCDDQMWLTKPASTPR